MGVVEAVVVVKIQAEEVGLVEEVIQSVVVVAVVVEDADKEAREYCSEGNSES